MKKIFFISFVLLACIASDMFGIPAFARKYNMTCKTCHSPFPSLKPYGDEFAANGFVLADQDAPRYFVNTGDDELSLIRDLPIALRLEGFLTYNNSDSKKQDFQTPSIVKFLSGGSIAKDISYYFYFIIEYGEIVGIEDAFVMFNNVFNSGVDIYAGQFQISDPLFKRELRLTLDDYWAYKYKIGKSKINLTYDRGLMLTYDLPTNTSLTLEVLNGTGIGTPVNDNFDTDKYKNFMLRASQDFSDNVRIGAFGYLGKEEIDDNLNNTVIAGADASFSAGPLELNLQYLERRDKNPFFLSYDSATVKTRGAFAELIFRPDGDDSKWYAVGLFNWVDDYNAKMPGINLMKSTLHMGYLLRRNIRLVGEYTYDFENKFGQFGIGIVSAF